MCEIKNHLPINLETFGFFQREIIAGYRLRNQCGRDFFYYALHYFYPAKFNPNLNNPVQIREGGIFGIRRVPVGLIWTGLSFHKIPKLLASLGLVLRINRKAVNTYVTFIKCLLPLNHQDYKQGIQDLERAIDERKAAGLDISIGLGGLIDHVMFVYGYDEENFYVFDTHEAIDCYEKITKRDDDRHIMKLPKTEVQKRWTIFSRVWVIERDSNGHLD